MAVYQSLQLKLILKLNTITPRISCTSSKARCFSQYVPLLSKSAGVNRLSLPRVSEPSSSSLLYIVNNGNSSSVGGRPHFPINSSLISGNNISSQPLFTWTKSRSTTIMSTIPDDFSTTATCSKRALATAPKDSKNKGEEQDSSSSPLTSSTTGSSDDSTSSSTSNASLSTKEKLKKAVKDYGATVIVFHVLMSLTSLGISYGLVSSGLDVAAILEYIGVGQSILESKVTQGASTFVIAYAFHKVFAPVRITITLTATPLIVRYLRNIGFLKKPVA